MRGACRKGIRHGEDEANDEVVVGADPHGHVFLW